MVTGTQHEGVSTTSKPTHINPDFFMITDAKINAVLESLYADAAENDPRARQAVQDAAVIHANEVDRYKAMRHVYMAVGRDFGTLLYQLGRLTGAKTVVEFGTSFGVSTIYLAAAVRDNGGGKIITTEFESAKVDRAKKNLAAAGLLEFVEFRVGDALATLRKDLPTPIEMVLLDGAKTMYLDVLKVIESNLRPGAAIAADNTDHDGLGPYLNYVRTPGNRYTSSAILTANRNGTGGHEISVRA